MRVKFNRSLGVTLMILVMVIVFAGLTGVFAMISRPPVAVKPLGLSALEAAETQALSELLDDINYRGEPAPIETDLPVVSDAPLPSGTRLYNSLLDNLLSSLHFYFTVSDDTKPAEFVTAWDADTGARIVSEARLFSLESNLSYLYTLELYSRLHTKAVFSEDLELERSRVVRIFDEEWRSIAEWPLGAYFDLIDLYELTDDETYLQWAERYAAGNDPGDANTPLMKAKSLAYRYQYGTPRTASPIHFYQAAILADWGNRYDPALLNSARFLFTGLKEMLFEERYNLLWKQASISQAGSSSMNVTQVFDTLEQLEAIRAILEYWKASGDPEALSLAKAILQGLWGSNSPMLNAAPDFQQGTFYGLYTAYDYGRETERFTQTEATISHILLFHINVLLNEATRGELRGDVDFLSNWLEINGPVYSVEANGYFSTYDENWEPVDGRWISSKAAIWMARSLAEDEWYRYRKAQALTTSGGSLLTE